MLYLNFSGINGELHNYRSGLDAHCNTCFNYFCDIYAEYLPQGIREKLDKKEGAVEQLDVLYHECERAGQKIYLFIDEYDHFTNAILSDADSLRRYTEETHKEGYLRAFFNKVKSRDLFQYQALLYHRCKPRDDGRPDQWLQHRYQLLSLIEI